MCGLCRVAQKHTVRHTMSRLLRSIYLKPWALPMLGLMLAALAIYVAAFTYQSAQAVVSTYMRDSAARQVQLFDEFRRIYIEEMLPKVQAAGLGVSARHRESPTDLPPSGHRAGAGAPPVARRTRLPRPPVQRPAIRLAHCRTAA